MNAILVILLLLAMGATAYVLVRGVMAMASGKDISGDGADPNVINRDVAGTIDFTDVVPKIQRYIVRGLTSDTDGNATGIGMFDFALRSAVDEIDPIASYHCSVTRLLPDGTTFQPQEVYSRERALYSYTMGNAIAAFEEDIKGSLTPGKLADVTVLSQDLLTVPDDRIRDTKVTMTIVGGKIRYRDGQIVPL